MITSEPPPVPGFPHRTHLSSLWGDWLDAKRQYPPMELAGYLYPPLGGQVHIAKVSWRTHRSGGTVRSWRKLCNLYGLDWDVRYYTLRDEVPEIVCLDCERQAAKMVTA